MGPLLKAALAAAERLDRDEQGEDECLRTWLGECALVSLLEDAGFRVEGPGDAADGDLAGRFWWTLTRDGWSDIECGPVFASSDLARGDAVRALLMDADLNWQQCSVRGHATDQFPSNFANRMTALR